MTQDTNTDTDGGEWTLTNPTNGTERAFDSRAAAEDAKAELEALSGTALELNGPDASADGGSVNAVDAEVVDHTADEERDSGDAAASEGGPLPDRPSVGTDPLTWMPEEFTDIIDGSVAINRKGYAVLAHHYDIAVTTELLTSPAETEWEYAIAQATATTATGRTHSAHGSAHVERGDDAELLVEMADTRSQKRALALATGVGMVAVEELQNEQ